MTTTRPLPIGSGYRPAAWCRSCHAPHCVTLIACPECGHPVAREPVALPDTAEQTAYDAYTGASRKRGAAFDLYVSLPLELRLPAFEAYLSRADETRVALDAWMELLRGKSKAARQLEGSTR
ncbi:hypothetical protein DESA109040_13830 [Deinococcus saxicola]|uniref:hypothetical protein n=1 Tax=Deinococcus saxicola TaxID=249406 RepID=UPI0039F0C475